jgi:hypothetical protein
MKIRQGRTRNRSSQWRISSDAVTLGVVSKKDIRVRFHRIQTTKAKT